MLMLRRGTVPPVSIKNPILNSPFAEPTRHFTFDEDLLSLPGDRVGDWMTDNDFVNRGRERLSSQVAR